LPIHVSLAVAGSFDVAVTSSEAVATDPAFASAATAADADEDEETAVSSAAAVVAPSEVEDVAANDDDFSTSKALVDGVTEEDVNEVDDADNDGVADPALDE